MRWAPWSQAPTFRSRGERLAHMDGLLAMRESAYSEVVPQLAEAFRRGTTARRAASREAGAHPGCRSGCGHRSLAMAERYQGRPVTAVDLPKSSKHSVGRRNRWGLADRHCNVDRRFHHVELPRCRFDRVVLANVLHLEPPDRPPPIRRVVRSLVGGGDR